MTDLLHVDDWLIEGWTTDKKNNKLLSGLPPGDLCVQLRKQFGKRLRWNELLLQPELGGQPIPGAALEQLYVALSERGWRIAQKPAEDAVLRVCQENRFHPVAVYLETLVKAPDLDPIDLDEIGSYWGVQDDQLSCRMLRVMLLGAVARIYDPGTKFDTMVVFKGEQGRGKSTSLRKLFGPKWLVDTQQPKHKDQLIVLHSCWCYEAAELDYMTSRKESGLIKGLLSSAVDTFLAPYGRFMEAHPRRSIMVGTCNRDDFLRDATGHRRFLVIEVDQIDCDRIEADRDRIWRAAVLAYQSGERPFLEEEDQQASNLRNKSFELENPFEATVGHWLRFGNGGDQFTLDDCLKGIDRCNLQAPDRHHVKEALKEHGCKPPKQQSRRNGVKVRLWTHYRAASAASPSTRGHEAPQPAAKAKDPGDLSHASPPLRERSEVQKTGGHQQSLLECAKKGEAARQQPKPLVGSGFDVDSDNWKPETTPPLNRDYPF